MCNAGDDGEPCPGVDVVAHEAAVSCGKVPLAGLSLHSLGFDRLCRCNFFVAASAAGWAFGLAQFGHHNLGFYGAQFVDFVWRGGYCLGFFGKAPFVALDVLEGLITICARASGWAHCLRDVVD